MNNQIKACAIRVRDNIISETQSENLIRSSEDIENPFTINVIDAATPEDINQLMLRHGVRWNYPWINEEYDDEIKVFKRPYKTKKQEAKIACALSHYLLWKQCTIEKIPFLILEHDSVFLRQLSSDALKMINASNKMFIGINDPRRATRRAPDFHKAVQKTSNENIVVECPWVEKDFSVIQGLAGGSAYIIKPKGASALIDAVNRFGLWHNDAFICHQMFPQMLGVTKTYFTKIQDRAISTTV